MIWVRWLPLAVTALLAVLAPLVARRVPPALAAPCLAAAALLASAASLLTCALFVALALVRVPALGAWLLVPRPVSGRVHVPGSGAALLAGGVAVAAVLAATRGLAACLRERRRALLLAGPGGGDLVLLRADEPAAYAVGGWPGRGRVVATTGLLDVLSPAEREVVLAHEHAHLRRGHQHVVLAARLASLVNPALRPLARAVDYLCERDADETAATRVGDRLLTARALGRAALPQPSPRRAGRLAVAQGHVPARVRALLQPPPALDWQALALILLLIALALCLMIGAGDSVHDADRIVELLRGAHVTP